MKDSKFCSEDSCVHSDQQSRTIVPEEWDCGTNEKSKGKWMLTSIEPIVLSSNMTALPKLVLGKTSASCQTQAMKHMDASKIGHLTDQNFHKASASDTDFQSSILVSSWKTFCEQKHWGMISPFMWRERKHQARQAYEAHMHMDAAKIGDDDNQAQWLGKLITRPIWLKTQFLGFRLTMCASHLNLSEDAQFVEHSNESLCGSENGGSDTENCSCGLIGKPANGMKRPTLCDSLHRHVNKSKVECVLFAMRSAHRHLWWCWSQRAGCGLASTHVLKKRVCVRWR